MIQIDWSFIEELEGFSPIAYVPADGAGNPLGKSGITVGAGVDLGQWSEAELRAHRVPDAILDQVRPYLGIRGREAQDALAERLLTLTYEDARMLTDCIRGDVLEKLVERYDAASDRPFKYLPQQAQTVIASVAFQYGNLESKTPQFWRQVVARDWPAAYANLRDFGDAYRTRRWKEAAYLKDLV